jgi:hypothetical protein
MQHTIKPKRNRTDIVNMGSSPTIQELDARKQFKNKSTYDKLLVTYLNTSIDSTVVNYIGFDNRYLNDLRHHWPICQQI